MTGILKTLAPNLFGVPFAITVVYAVIFVTGVVGNVCTADALSSCWSLSATRQYQSSMSSSIVCATSARRTHSAPAGPCLRRVSTSLRCRRRSSVPRLYGGRHLPQQVHAHRHQLLPLQPRHLRPALPRSWAACRNLLVLVGVPPRSRQLYNHEVDSKTHQPSQSEILNVEHEIVVDKVFLPGVPTLEQL